MTYNPIVPLSSESPNTSASPIQVNFSKFASIFSSTAAGIIYNHMPMNDFHQGKHAAVIMQNQSGDPGVTGNQTVLYAKNATAVTGGTQPNLFAQIPKFLPTNLDRTNAANTGMQLTYPTVSKIPPLYQSFLPGGYILYFGSTVVSGGPPRTFLITLIPTPSEILCAQIIPTGANGLIPWDASVIVTQPDKITARSQTCPNNSKFLFLAIAKA